MTKRYSITEAKDHLAALVHEVQQVDSIEITRGGKPVAVLISKSHFDRMQLQKICFWDAYQSFKKRVDLERSAIDVSQIWGDVRDRSSGRKVDVLQIRRSYRRS